MSQVTGRDGFIIGSAINKVIERLNAAPEEIVLGRNSRELARTFEAFMSGAAEAEEPFTPPADFIKLATMALYLAIRFEQAKPKRKQARSDMQDMKAVLLHHGLHDALLYVEHDEAAGIRPANLIDERSHLAGQA